MSDNSDIEWTDATWNPMRGCRKISPGCKNCCGETFAERLGLPLAWAKPRRVFVDSMSDLFMDEVAVEYIEAVFGVMQAAGHHTFQVLTKRAERMRALVSGMTASRCAAELCAGEYVPPDLFRSAGGRRDRFAHDPPGWAWPARNVWLGVSVEDQKHGAPRIDELRETPAALRFLSIEPLLEDLGPLDLRGIGWVIVGGESGQRARECDMAAVRSVVRQCRAAGVPVFVKQLGRVPLLDGKRLLLVNDEGKADRKGKTLAQWPEDLQVREFPRAVA